MISADTYMIPADNLKIIYITVEISSLILRSANHMESVVKCFNMDLLVCKGSNQLFIDFYNFTSMFNN